MFTLENYPEIEVNILVLDISIYCSVLESWPYFCENFLKLTWNNGIYLIFMGLYATKKGW